jgi:hypothetical protein
MASKSVWAMLPGLVLVLAFAGIGQGQLGIGEPGEGVKLALLRLPAVQKELDLTERQKLEVARLGDETKAAKKQVESASKEQAKDKAEEVPKGMPDPAREALEAQFFDLESRADASLKKLLDARQRVRLSEIALQAEGPQAFLKPELIQALDLLEDQLDEIRAILGVVRQQQEQAKAIQKRSADLGTFAVEKVSKEQQKIQARTTALKVGKRAMTEIGKVLSKKQRDKYNKLLGEPFNLAGLVDEKGRRLFDESASLAAMLLKLPPVRQELELSVEQTTALDHDEPAARVLKPSQRIRLDQIALQAEGASAFTRPEVLRSLRLDEEQVDQIEGILAGLGDDRRQLRDARKQADEARKAAGDPDADPAIAKTRKEQEKEEMWTAADQMGSRVMARISAVLTKAQRASFRKQLGDPFDFTRLRGAAGQAIAKDAGW